MLAWTLVWVAFATEVPYDGVDQDRDGSDLVDVDRDGWAGVLAGGPDCNDSDPTVRPDAWDRYGDRVDRDCDGWDGMVNGPGASRAIRRSAPIGLGALIVVALGTIRRFTGRS